MDGLNLSRGSATIEKILKEYATNLSVVIKSYAKEKKLTVISGNLLTNYGGQDITDLIVTKTLKKVREDA